MRTRTPACFGPQDEKKQKTDHGHGHSHSHDHGEAHAKIVALGTVTVGGATFMIDRDGQVESGVETEFGVELVGAAAAVPSAAWLANPDGEEVSDPVSGEGHDQHWHFKVTPLMPVKRSAFVLRVGEEKAAISFARGAAPCNGGILSVFMLTPRRARLPQSAGDAGDPELWLYGGSRCRTS